MAEQGSGESALINNKEEESLSSRGQDSSDCCLGGPAEENGNGLHLLDLSRHLQSDGNDNTLSVAPDKLGGCSLSVLSGGTHEVSCLTGSSGKNGLVDGRMEPSENKDDGSPRGSLDMKEVNRSTHGSTEVDNAGTQEGSPRKNDNTLSLLQTSHKHEDNCYHENETGLCSGAPSGRMGCTSEKKTTVESTPTMSSGTSTTVLLRASANSSSGWEEGRGGRRKRRRKSTDGGGGDESEASRKRKRRKQRAVARRFDLCRRRALVVARKSKKWRR
uniref:Uncharacterized protein n=1 Tax=Arundo donax TaxID=35708 RepID=A0A0A8YB78_ARUDO